MTASVTWFIGQWYTPRIKMTMGTDDLKKQEIQEAIRAQKPDMPNVVVPDSMTAGSETPAAQSAAPSSIATAEEEESDRQYLLPGTVINDHYLIVNRIGAGGMGEVYRVLDKSTEKTYALKMISAEASRKDKFAKRLKQEIQAATILSHPNIVAVYDVGVMKNGVPFFIMDCIEGTCLQNVLDTHRALDRSRALNIFIQITKALGHAHSKGIIHRDLKPANVLLSQGASGGDLVKLVDFGIAKINDDSIQTKLTQTGELIGSPTYMSPEQCRGYAVDGRSDIYSLGCIMYEVITGKVPFDGENTMSILLMHVMEAANPVSDDSNDELSHLIMRCLEKDPADRYPDANALLADLENLREARPIQAKPKKKPEKKVSAKIVVGTAASLLLAGALAGGYYVAGKISKPNGSRSFISADAPSQNWDLLDVDAQTKLNEGKYKDAINVLELAQTRADDRQRKISLQKLGIAYHIVGNKIKEHEIDHELAFKPVTGENDFDMMTAAPTPQSPTAGVTAGASKQQQTANYASPKKTRARSDTPAAVIQVTALRKSLSLMRSVHNKEELATVEEIAHEVLVTASHERNEHCKVAVIEFLKSAIPELERLLGNDSLICHRLENIYADSLVSEHENEQAMAPSLDCVSFFKKHPELAPDVRNESLVRMAELYNWSDHPKEAEPLAKEAMANLANAKDEQSQRKLIRAKTAYADALFYQQRLEEAESAFHDVIEHATASDPSSLQTAIGHLANVYEMRNAFPKAEKALKDAIAQHSSKSALTAACLQQALGDLYFRQPSATGQWTKAEPYFVQALQTRQHELLPEDPAVRESLRALINFDLHSRTYQKPGRSTDALAKELVAILDRSQAPAIERAKAYSQLAFLLSELGQKEEAARQIHGIVDLAKATPSVIDTFDDRLMKAAEQTNTLDPVEGLLTQRLKKFRNSSRNAKSNLSFAQTLDELANVYGRKHKMKESGELLAQASDIVSKIPPTRLNAQERWQAALILEHRAQFLQNSGQPWQKYLDAASALRSFHS